MTLKRFLVGFTSSMVGAAVAIGLLQQLGDVTLPCAIKSSWSYAWHELAHESDTFGFVILLNAWGILTYWLFGAVYALLDFKVIDAIRYKTQPSRNVPPIAPEVFFKAARGVLLNQFVIGVAFSYVCMPLIRLRGISFDPEETPTKLSDFAKHLVGYAICEEIFFYSSHRLFHEVPFLYKRFHKQHHEYVAPIAVAARYAHPLEDMLANVWPVMSGPLICGSHITFFFLWIALALFSTETSHSGFHLPFMPPNEVR